MKRPRIETFDLLKGLGILLMIVGHSTGKMSGLRDFIFSFHMPLFFLISGYFFTSVKWKTLLSKNAQRLLVPYLFTGLLIGAYLVFDAWQVGGNLDFVALKRLKAIALGSGAPRVLGMNAPIGAIWFLVALFWSTIFLNLALRTKYPLFLCLLFSGIGFALHGEIFLPLSFQPGLTGALFLYVGYWVKQQGFLNADPLVPSMSALSASSNSSALPDLPTPANVPFSNKGLLPLVAFALWFTSWQRGRLEMSCDYYRLWYFDMLGAISACYLLWLGMRAFEHWLQAHAESLSLTVRCANGIRRTLLFFGKYSLVVLCFHLVDLTCIPWKYVQPIGWGEARLPLLWIEKIIFAYFMVQFTLRVPLLRKVFKI